MKYQEEYRDPLAAKKLLSAIRDVTTKPWTIMEVCGGQTHSIVRYGIDELLPEEIELVHGPGCPVCVTPLELIDKGIEIASREDVIFCSFGDMLRVPGSRRDLFEVKASGGDVRIVYSPLDCLRIAEQNPDCNVVFLRLVLRPLRRRMLWPFGKQNAEGLRIFRYLFRTSWFRRRWKRFCHRKAIVFKDSLARDTFVA